MSSSRPPGRWLTPRAYSKWMRVQGRTRNLKRPKRSLGPSLSGDVPDAGPGCWPQPLLRRPSSWPGGGASASGLIPAQFLPSPESLVERFVLDVTRGPLLAHSWVTLSEALLGSAVAILFGLPLGYLMARLPFVDQALAPYVAASQAVPAIALAPLLVLWMGYGLVPTVVLCAIMSFFPMLVTTMLGLRQVPREIIEASRLDGAAWFDRLRFVEVPSALPNILGGVRAGVTLSITGAVVGEFTMGGKGLGTLLTLNRDANDIPGVFSTLVALLILALSLYGLTSLAYSRSLDLED